jgi:uncharacterized membrane protein
MSFLIVILVGSLIAYIPQYIWGDRRDHRMAMRHGLAIGLSLTGVDHFLSATSRYVPMMPDFLSGAALPLVYFTGVAELAGALGLVLPVGVCVRLGLPNLQRLAGILLALMFALLVIANVNVAIKGTGVEGLEFGQTYFVLRPFLQPVFILWALYSVGISLGRNRLRTRAMKPGETNLCASS